MVASSTGLGAPMCPRCGCRELYVRRAFPRRVGVGVVVVAGGAFLVLAARPGTFRYGVYVLIAAAALDALLALFVGRVAVCYRCHAESRELGADPRLAPFDLATAERFRQG